MDGSVALYVHCAKIKLVHCIIILAQVVGQDLHSWSEQHTVQKEWLLVSIWEECGKLALPFISDCHRPLTCFCLWGRFELYVHFDYLERLQTEHCFNFRCNYIGLLLCSISFFLFRAICDSSWLVCRRHWMHSSTICLGLHYLKRTVNVQVENQVCLAIICKGNLLDFLWGIFLTLHRPIFQSHVVLVIHLHFSINAEVWVNSCSI